MTLGKHLSKLIILSLDSFVMPSGHPAKIELVLLAGMLIRLQVIRPRTFTTAQGQAKPTVLLY